MIPKPNNSYHVGLCDNNTTSARGKIVESYLKGDQGEASYLLCDFNASRKCMSHTSNKVMSEYRFHKHLMF